ncbi:MAG: hypothetical protein V3T31_07745 [candidate division Zixibacteria bacterium]
MKLFLIVAFVLLLPPTGVFGQEGASQDTAVQETAVQETAVQDPAYLETAAQFKLYCASCHWIGGGRLVGPDLKNVAQRQERDLLVRFVLNPKAMLDAQDPYIMKLKDESNGAIMTNVPGMTRALAEALLDFVDAESQLDSSQFMGSPAALEPFSQAIADSGMQIFTGQTVLANSGPACTSCHSINADGGILGGQLGPELTGVFERLNGRTAISAWLSSPPTETMRSVFKDHQLEEIEAKQLSMFFESVSGRVGYNLDSTTFWILLVLSGLGGGALGMFAFGGLWRNRFRAVRRPLINETKKQRLS